MSLPSLVIMRNNKRIFTQKRGLEGFLRLHKGIIIVPAMSRGDERIYGVRRSVFCPVLEKALSGKWTI